MKADAPIKSEGRHSFDKIVSWGLKRRLKIGEKQNTWKIMLIFRLVPRKVSLGCCKNKGLNSQSSLKTCNYTLKACNYTKK